MDPLVDEQVARGAKVASTRVAMEGSGLGFGVSGFSHTVEYDPSIKSQLA